jgi:hypothetical protein
MPTGPPDVSHMTRSLICAKFMHLHVYIYKCILFIVNLYFSWVWHFLEKSTWVQPWMFHTSTVSSSTPQPSHCKTLCSFAVTFHNRNLTLSIPPLPDEGTHTDQHSISCLHTVSAITNSYSALVSVSALDTGDHKHAKLFTTATTRRIPCEVTAAYVMATPHCRCHHTLCTILGVSEDIILCHTSWYEIMFAVLLHYSRCVQSRLQ